LNGDLSLKICIIDIGAGNARLAIFAATLLNAFSICIDRENPLPELRAENYLNV